MKAKIIVLMIFIILTSLYIYRVKTISDIDFYPKVIHYYLNEEVIFENDFYDSIQSNMEGYSVTFLDYELFAKEDFLIRYHLQDNAVFPNTSYVLVVKANFKNKTDNYSNDHGINAAQFILQDNAYMTFASRDLISEINEGTNYAFSLMPNSEKDVLIPFCIDLDYISIKRIKNGEGNIVVTLYPNKKVISLTDSKQK